VRGAGIKVDTFNFTRYKLIHDTFLAYRKTPVVNGLNISSFSRKHSKAEFVGSKSDTNLFLSTKFVAEGR
jgi:hypothetical protein